MGIVKQAEAEKQTIAEGRTRMLAQTSQLMIAVIDFRDGPTSEPDPPHSHPHEQITYVAEGEIYFCIENEKHHLSAGDLFTLPCRRLRPVESGDSPSMVVLVRYTIEGSGDERRVSIMGCFRSFLSVSAMGRHRLGEDGNCPTVECFEQDSFFLDEEVHHGLVPSQPHRVH